MDLTLEMFSLERQAQLGGEQSLALCIKKHLPKGFKIGMLPIKRGMRHLLRQHHIYTISVFCLHSRLDAKWKCCRTGFAMSWEAQYRLNSQRSYSTINNLESNFKYQ